MRVIGGLIGGDQMSWGLRLVGVCLGINSSRRYCP